MSITLSMPGYAKLRVGGARGLVSEPCLPRMQEILADGTLYQFASTQPGARSFKGRIPAFVLDLGGCGSVVVRQAMRGGLIGKTARPVPASHTRTARAGQLVATPLAGVPTRRLSRS